MIYTIQNVTGPDGWALQETRQIYKYNASTEDGRPLTLNISLAPFEAARGVVTGTLVVIENVTERMQLEQQLLEREKLLKERGVDYSKTPAEDFATGIPLGDIYLKSASGQKAVVRTGA